MASAPSFANGQKLLSEVQSAITRKDYHAAVQSFQRSIDEGVEEVSSIYHLAEIRRSQGDEEAAAKLLEQAREFGKVSAS